MDELEAKKRNAEKVVSDPEKDRPLITIRLSLGETEPDTWKDLYGVFQRNPKLCDEVWFSVTGDCSIDTLETHRMRAANMAKAAADLRKLGIIPSLQFERTIGYGLGIQEDNPGYDWGNYVGGDGVEVAYVSCPRQAKFHRYLYETGKIYGQWQPGSVWLDDDVHLELHYPTKATGGCHCQDCLAEFSKRENHEYTRESLVEAYKKDKALYDRWFAFQIESVGMMEESLVRGFYEFSPETRFGLQHTGTPARTGIIQELYKAAHRRVCARPGGGAWDDHDPYMIFNKAMAISWLLADQPGYDICGRLSPEIEDCPRGYCSKTARGRKLESIIYLAVGGDSLTYLIHGPGAETIEWYEKHTFAPLAKMADDLRAYARANDGTVAVGVGMYKLRTKPWDAGLFMVGVPFSSHSPESCCRMIRREMIEVMDDAELAAALKGDILLDGAAVEEIDRRGFGTLIGGVSAEKPPRRACEFYTDDPLNDGIVYHAYLTTSSRNWLFKFPASGNFRVLANYVLAPEEIREKFNNYNMAGKTIVGVASLLLERPDGTRVAFLGNDGFQTLQASTSRVTFLNRVADYVAHEKLPVLAKEPTQMLLIPRVDAQDQLKTVAIVNQSIDHSASFTLQMRGVPEKVQTAKLHFPGEKIIDLPVTRRDGFACVTIPEMEGWDGAWLEIVK